MKERALYPATAVAVVLAPYPGTRCEAVSDLRVRVWREANARLGLAFALTGDLARLRLPAAGGGRGPLPSPEPPRSLSPAPSPAPSPANAPAPSPAPRGAELWRHTCFEAFVAAADGPGYLELNVSPAGAWDLLAFHGYRAGGPLPAGVPAPEITLRQAGERLEVAVRLDLARLVAEAGLPDLAAAPRLGLAAMLEDDAGTLTHWAIRHPAAQPDFHAPDSFALRLA